MPRKKRSGKKSGQKSGSRKKTHSFFSNLIFFSSIICLLIFLAWLALIYLPWEKIYPQAVVKPVPPLKPDPEISLSRQGQKLLLKTREELLANSSIFQQPPVFFDCPVDEHYLNCLQISFGPDTDFILARKFIQDLWERQGAKARCGDNHHPEACELLVALNNSKRIAEIMLKSSEITKPARPKNPLPAKPARKGARVAIVIDDLGDSEQEALEIARIPGPIALSILPFQNASREVLNLAQRWHKPAMLHMPMEPLEDTGKNAGPEALTCSMSPDQVSGALSRALDSLPGVVGVNNHMGSAFTARAELMEPALKELKRRGLFFLDSRTSGQSVGYQLGRELGLKSCERKIFLDNLQDPEMIAQKLSQLCRIAREEGSAIGIGHPYPETIRVLGEKIDELEIAGCKLVPIQELCQ